DRCERLVLVIYSGRPIVAPDLITQADAVVAAWLPGTETTHLPDLLLGRLPFEGRLPQPWPRNATDLGNKEAVPLYPIEHGLRLGSSVDLTMPAPDAGSEA
ncbi:MAG: glycoside hydrolase family 3 C-terminal domain-containing protein, partial [Acidimicrobiia bacterium]|nr:glycoside hydrolase family 3 C-terminal domain-containing protein [Acidimicrobiia bacterium]